jgi:predicted TIM-barrel fold metal-dependent hydrolase
MVNNIKHAPSYYMGHNIYGSFMRDPIGIKNRNEKGGRNIMWSTDYPHSESTWPNSRACVKAFFKDVDEEDKRRIVCDNARTFYGLS